MNSYTNMGFGETIADWLGLGSADRERQFNSAEAQKERDWQTEMSNSAHQREVADLQSAGLNPILSVTGGQGATSSAGALAHGGSSNGSVSGLASLINSASNLIDTTARRRGQIPGKRTEETIFNKAGQIVGSAVKVMKYIG